jgi:hypothetical protein
MRISEAEGGNRSWSITIAGWAGFQQEALEVNRLLMSGQYYLQPGTLDSYKSKPRKAVVVLLRSSNGPKDK